jgi:hypothetical protein
MDWTYTRRGSYFGLAALAIGIAALPWTDHLLARGIMTLFWIWFILGAVDLLRHALRPRKRQSTQAVERLAP